MVEGGEEEQMKEDEGSMENPGGGGVWKTVVWLLKVKRQQGLGVGGMGDAVGGGEAEVDKDKRQ